MRKIKNIKQLKYISIIFITTLSLITILSFIFSKTPIDTIHYFLFGPFQNKFVFGNMLNDATTLIIAALGISIVFHIGFFNLGGEGQIYFGAFLSTIFLLKFPELNRVIAIFVSIIIAMIGGGVICLIPAILKVRLKINELIGTYLFSRIIVLIVNFFITGMFNDKNSNLLTTEKIAGSFKLTQIFKPSYLNTGIILAIILSIITYIYLYKTRFGYNTIIAGRNKEFANYGAINVKKYILVSAFVSGALSALAGLVSVLGTHFAVIKEFSSGIGFSAITVCLIAKNNPLFIILSAIFFAYIEAGAKASTINTSTSFEMAILIEAIIFIIITTNIAGGLKGKKND